MRFGHSRSDVSAECGSQDRYEKLADEKYANEGVRQNKDAHEPYHAARSSVDGSRRRRQWRGRILAGKQSALPLLTARGLHEAAQKQNTSRSCVADEEDKRMISAEDRRRRRWLH